MNAYVRSSRCLYTRFSVSGVTARGLKSGTAFPCNQTNCVHMRAGDVNVPGHELPLRIECAEYLNGEENISSSIKLARHI